MTYLKIFKIALIRFTAKSEIFFYSTLIPICLKNILFEKDIEKIRKNL